MRRLALVVVALAACRGGRCGALCSFDADTHATLSVSAGRWNEVPAPDAPSTPNVLAQEASNGESVFNVALFDGMFPANLDLRVKLKAIAGKIDQGGGVVWRAKGPSDYYLARYNPLESDFRVFKVVHGVRTQLAGASVGPSPGWHELRVKMAGDAIECELDGKVRIEARDATFREAGRIGLWTKADAQTQFDDVLVVGLPGA